MATAFLKPKELSSKFKSAANGFAIKDSHTFSSYSKALSVATDKKSVANSKRLFDFLSTCVQNLPIEKIKEKDIAIFTKTVSMFNESKNSLETFLEPLKKIMGIDVVLDAKDVCIIIDNLNKCISQCEYISDYLTSAIEISEAKSSMKNIKPISLEELHKILEEV